MAILWVVIRLSRYVSDYQVKGEGSKGGQTGINSGLSEGVLEDGGSGKSLAGSRRESSKARLISRQLTMKRIRERKRDLVNPRGCH